MNISMWYLYAEIGGLSIIVICDIHVENSLLQVAHKIFCVHNTYDILFVVCECKNVIMF
jgi:hypothetical protein